MTLVRQPNGFNLGFCIDDAPQDAVKYTYAQERCRNRGLHVCVYEELDALMYWGGNDDGAYDPDGKWLGHFVGDGKVLCGNKSVVGYNNGFDGVCDKNETHQYWCCMSFNR